MHIDLRIHVNLHIHIHLLPTEAQFKLLSAVPRWVLRQGDFPVEFFVFSYSIKRSKYTKTIILRKAKINYIFDLSAHAKEGFTTAKHVCLRTSSVWVKYKRSVPSRVLRPARRPMGYHNAEHNGWSWRTNACEVSCNRWWGRLLSLEICMHARFCVCKFARSMTKIATVVELSSCMGDTQVLAPLVATWRAERNIDLECRRSLARRVDSGNQHIDQTSIEKRPKINQTLS